MATRSFLRLLAWAAPLFAVPGVSLAQSTLGSDSFHVSNPLSVNTICGLIQALLKAFLAIGTPIAVLFLVYAGFLFILARGNPMALQKARKNLVWTILGIVIFLGAWTLGQVVAATINQLQPGTITGQSACS